jgi:hypothetical protein
MCGRLRNVFGWERVYPVMRRNYIALGLAVLVTAGCPQGERVLGNGGFGIGGGGGGAASDILTFTVQPSNATAGNIITPAVQVTVLDTLARPDSSFTGTVTITLGTNPVGGTLSGTSSVVPSNAVAVFGDLVINKAGTGYTLRAGAPGLSSVTSGSFDITSP